MEAADTLRALLDRRGIIMEASHRPKDGPARTTEWPQVHFTIALSSDRAGSLRTSYSCGLGVVEDWAKDNRGKLPPGCWRGLTAKKGSVAYAEAVEAAATRYEPDIVDVVGCLLTDASALDYDLFEQWASDLGYDTDSRSAERTYNTCREHGAELRIMLRDDFDTAREISNEL